MSAINEHTQLNLSRPALGKKSIHRRSRRTAGKQNIIYQNNVLIFDRKTNLFFQHHGLRAQRREVIAIEGNIQRTHRNLRVLNACDNLAKPLSYGHAATADTDQSKRIHATVFFYDLVCQPYQCPFNFGCGHQLGLLAKGHLAGGVLGVHRRVCLVLDV